MAESQSQVLVFGIQSEQVVDFTEEPEIEVALVVDIEYAVQVLHVEITFQRQQVLP